VVEMGKSQRNQMHTLTPKGEQIREEGRVGLGQLRHSFSSPSEGGHQITGVGLQLPFMSSINTSKTDAFGPYRPFAVEG
jgi:hypothetical protein